MVLWLSKIISFVVLYLVLSLALVPTTNIVVNAEQTIPADSSLIQWMGRIRKPGDGSVHFDWLGVGARVFYSGKYLIANYAADHGIGSPWKVATWEYAQNYYIPTSINWVSPAYLNNNGTTISVVVSVSGLESIVSLNSPPQYFIGSTGNDICIVSFTTDGEFSSPSAPFTRHIEFVGDSITAATNIHSHPPCADGGLQCDYSVSWAGLLCANFSANCSTIAVGGKGLVRNCCDNSKKMPDYFQQTEYSSAGPDYTYAATGYKPNAIVIALGTNDYSGSPPPNIDTLFIQGYVNFIQNITKAYGGSGSTNITYFCTVGPMSDAYLNATENVISQVNALGIRAYLLNVMGSPTDGCAGHPGVQGHHEMAAIAQPIIANIMGW